MGGRESRVGLPIGSMFSIGSLPYTSSNLAAIEELRSLPSCDSGDRDLCGIAWIVVVIAKLDRDYHQQIGSLLHEKRIVNHNLVS